VSGVLKSETIKTVTTRTLLGLIVGAIAVALLGAFSVIMSGDPQNISGPLHARQYWLLASINVSLFAVVLGVRSFTDEFRHGTVVPTMLASPRRFRVLFAKLIVIAVFGAVLGLAAAVAMLVLATPLTSARGGSLTVAGGDIVAIAGLALASALWAAIGVGLGAAIRSQVAAIVSALVWILIVENLGSANLGNVARYLPGQAGHAVADATQADNILAQPIGALVLAVYVVVVASVASLLLSSRDIQAG
jgi:ABC-2 type transport system permease protein